MTPTISAASEVNMKWSYGVCGADSACFWRRRILITFFVSGGGTEEINFFLNFFCKFQTHYCFKFFLESFVDLLQACPLLTQHY